MYEADIFLLEIVPHSDKVEVGGNEDKRLGHHRVLVVRQELSEIKIQYICYNPQVSRYHTGSLYIQYIHYNQQLSHSRYTIYTLHSTVITQSTHTIYTLQSAVMT